MGSLTVTDLNDPLMRHVIEQTRIFMRDYAALNRLTKGVDHSPRHILWAAQDCLSDWMSTPPFIGQNLAMIFDRGWSHIFIRGTAIALLESLMMLHMRNYLSYSDGGVNVQTENPQMIQAALQLLKNSYEQKKTRALIALNIENALGAGMGVHSELVHINSFFGSL
jgi:hypothetical protein